MRKPDDLKATLLAQVSHLRDNPESLSLFTDSGRVACRATGTLSFEQRYKLVLVAQDYAGDLDHLIVPLLAWVSVNQPDLLERAPNEPFTFETEILEAGAQDVSIELELTELVRVEVEAGAWKITPLPEPTRVAAFAGIDTAVTLLRAMAEDVGTGDQVSTGA